MESDESRPGSSASNSSSSSVSSAESNDNMNNGSRSSSVRKSRSNSSSASSSRNNSPDSEQQLKVPRSPLNGDDKDESLLSTNDNKSLRSISPDGETNGRDIRSRSPSRESNSSNVSSQDNGNHRRNNTRSVSRNQSISPTRQSNLKSSRRSSVSSVASDDGQLKADDISDNELGPDNTDSLQEKPESIDENDKHKSDTLNMSHEDLSDVSDLDSAPVSPARNEEHDDVNENEEVSIELLFVAKHIKTKLILFLFFNFRIMKKNAKHVSYQS